MEQEHLWWHKGIIYQVYPRSFADSNGDGVGDLPGIIDRLDYLAWLGVDAVWISPIYPSPMADFGYDISDYCDIHPMFGTLADFDRLLAEAHCRGLKVILDFVPNHSSDQHPWFLESASSRRNPRRDWYIWRDAAPDGGPPNNWLSVFGGSAWQWHEPTAQYYLHSFLKEQPDLNWRNPALRNAMMDAMRFWLERGVDGFRVDVMWHMIKDEHFRDNPVNPHFKPKDNPYHALLPVYSSDQPEVHDIVAEMRRLVDSYGERVLIGEIYLPIESLVAYYGEDGTGAHLPFNFLLLGLPWDAGEIEAAAATYEAALPDFAWPNWVLGNHDNHRVTSRIGLPQARVAAMLLLMLRGTPTLYYGEEIGLLDVEIPADRIQDPHERDRPDLNVGRDPERTPMQWDDGPGAGFTEGEPWLPLADDYRTNNVAAQRDNPDSMLTLHRRLIDLRRAEPALHVGEIAFLPADGAVLAFLRQSGDRRFLIALNLGARPARFRPERLEPRGTIVLTTQLTREGEPIRGEISLDGDEGVIILLDNRG